MGVREGVQVGRGVLVGVTVGFGGAVAVGVAVGMDVGVDVGWAIGLAVGVAVGGLASLSCLDVWSAGAEARVVVGDTGLGSCSPTLPVLGVGITKTMTAARAATMLPTSASNLRVSLRIVPVRTARNSTVAVRASRSTTDIPIGCLQGEVATIQN